MSDPPPYPRYPSSQCSVSGLRWRVVWSLIWWKTVKSPPTLSSSTAGQLYSMEIMVLFQCGTYSLVWLKVPLCFHTQHLWSWPWRCDQSVHHHLTAASGGWGKCRWCWPRPGRDAASVSCRCTGASAAGHPNVTQHQWADRQSLRCHVKGLDTGTQN